MPLSLTRPRFEERLTDPDWHPANTTAAFPRWATLSAGMPGYREIRAPFAGGELVVAIEGEPPAWVWPTVHSLLKLMELRVGWDSYAGSVIGPAYVSAALNLLVRVMKDDAPSPTVVPTSRGGVQLEWHTRGVDLEVEFETPTRVHGLFEDRRTGSSWEEDLSFNLHPLASALATLSGRR